jgi:signal transduction histidine kinase
MSWAYTYDPHLWPALISFALVTFLGWYSWRRRTVPGAKPFVFACLFAALWAFGAMLEISALDFSTQVFWVKFQTVWQMPTATAITCFVLVYAGLGRWLTRRNLVLLAIPPLIVLALIITNDNNHLIWTGFGMDGSILPFAGRANRILVGYAYILALINIVVLLWLAVHSPRHRWPVAIMLFGQITGRGLYLLNNIYAGLLGPGESVLAVVGVLSAAYAIAFFRFHVFDPVPLARTAVLEQMREGMLVLDLQGRIVDLNHAAAKILGEPVAGLRGRTAAELLSTNPGILAKPDKTAIIQSEISLGIGKAARNYNLNLMPLTDRRGELLGQLLLLHDVTEQKSAQVRILEQQSVVATLQERERLARELHDGIGQVLGYVSMQAQTIRKWVQDGNTEKADSLLNRLAEVARDAHADVRESILSLKAGSPQEWSFVPTLRGYLNDFQAHYGIHTELVLEDGLKEDNFKPDAEVQLLRVIQEALTNARKHSGAQTVRVTIKQGDHRGYITVADDGSGFDPAQLNREAGTHFGLSFMRERMMQVGGRVDIDSQPGTGTVVKLEAPIWNQQEDTA